MTARTPALRPALLTFALMTLIATLSLTPDTPQPGDDAFAWLVHVTPTALQKSMHVLSYATLALSLAWTLRPVHSIAARFAVTFIVAAGFGALMEYLQLFVPGRFASLYDILLDAIGALIGVAAGAWLSRLRPAK